MSLQAQINETRLKAGQALEEAKRLAAEWREADDAKKPELDEKFNRANKDATALCADVQRLEAHQAVETQAAAFSQPQNRLQYKGGQNDQDRKRDAHRRVFDTMLRHGTVRAMQELDQHGAFEPSEKHALLGSNDSLGGFLVPDDFRAELLKAEAGFAAVRGAGARVVPTSLQTLVFPTVTAGTDPYSTDLQSNASVNTGVGYNWKSEGHTTGGTAPPLQNKPTFGNQRIPVHIWQPDAVEISQELLEDSVIPLDPLLAELFGEIKGLDEDWAFIRGSGVGQPEGILNSGCSTIASGNASLLTYGGIINLWTGLPAQYRQNGSMLMNSATFGAILKFEDTGGTLIMPPNAAPGTLFMRPVTFSEFMPNVAASATPIAFGSFRHYVIAERTDMRIQRLNERFAPNVGFLPTARLGGQLTRREAFRLQVIST